MKLSSAPPILKHGGELCGQSLHLTPSPWIFYNTTQQTNTLTLLEWEDTLCLNSRHWNGANAVSAVFLPSSLLCCTLAFLGSALCLNTCGYKNIARLQVCTVDGCKDMNVRVCRCWSERHSWEQETGFLCDPSSSCIPPLMLFHHHYHHHHHQHFHPA